MLLKIALGFFWIGNTPIYLFNLLNIAPKMFPKNSSRKFTENSSFTQLGAIYSAQSYF